MEQIKGIPTEICVDGKTLRNVKPQGTERPVYRNIYLLDSESAEKLFLTDAAEESPAVNVGFSKIKEAGPDRNITIGVQRVAEAPTDADFEDAAVYTIDLSGLSRENRLLQINYRGDVARLYADGKLIADNFYNGRPFLYGLWRLPADCNRLELRILPLQENMPVYFPREANTDKPGEEVTHLSIIPL